MPHIIVKLWPGKSEARKRELSDALVHQVTKILQCGEESVSVGFEEVSAEDWQGRVYGPDIEGHWDTLTKRPGYGPRAGR